MALDLNCNGKPDIEEVKEKLGEARAAIQGAVTRAVSPIEEYTGKDVNGDGVIGEVKVIER